MPQITEAVNINGYAQPGASPNTTAVGSDAVLKIVLSGASASGADGLEFGTASSTDLIGASFSEGFVYFDVDAPPYPARNTLHAGEDSYLEISVRAT